MGILHGFFPQVDCSSCRISYLTSPTSSVAAFYCYRCFLPLLLPVFPSPRLRSSPPHTHPCPGPCVSLTCGTVAGSILGDGLARRGLAEELRTGSAESEHSEGGLLDKGHRKSPQEGASVRRSKNRHAAAKAVPGALAASNECVPLLMPPNARPRARACSHFATRPASLQDQWSFEVKDKRGEPNTADVLEVSVRLREGGREGRPHHVCHFDAVHFSDLEPDTPARERLPRNWPKNLRWISSSSELLVGREKNCEFVL